MVVVIIYFKQEIYLYEIKDYRYIIALAIFRIGSHNLKIETGLYSKPKLEVNLKKCIYCDSHETEDEVHFLNKCILLQMNINYYIANAQIIYMISIL